MIINKASVFEYPFLMTAGDDLNIILIDDDEAANFLNTRLIQKVSPQYPITSFTDPREALLYFLLEESSDPVSRYLLFLDINMPIMDGFEFLDILQDSTYSHLDITVVILSSSTNSMDKERAESYVIHDYYVKPLNQERLRNLFLAFE